MKKNFKKILAFILPVAVLIPSIFVNASSNLSSINSQQLMAVEDLFEDKQWNNDFEDYLKKNWE